MGIDAVTAGRGRRGVPRSDPEWLDRSGSRRCKPAPSNGGSQTLSMTPPDWNERAVGHDARSFLLASLTRSTKAIVGCPWYFRICPTGPRGTSCRRPRMSTESSCSLAHAQGEPPWEDLMGDRDSGSANTSTRDVFIRPARILWLTAFFEAGQLAFGPTSGMPLPPPWTTAGGTSPPGGATQPYRGPIDRPEAVQAVHK